MGLKPIKDTIADDIPVFAKVLELFTGGFSLVSTNLRDDVILPAGSLFTVSETTRQATPIKTAKMVTNATANQLTYLVDNAAYLKVGDIIGATGSATGHGITKIEASGDNDVLTVATSFGAAVATGDVLYKVSAAGGNVVSGTANAISMYDVKAGADNLSEGVTMLRRGTAYKNRLQPHLAGHLTDVDAVIQISESY